MATNSQLPAMRLSAMTKPEGEPRAIGQPQLRLATPADAAAIHAQVQATYESLKGLLPESTVFAETVDVVIQSFASGPLWVIDAGGEIVASVRADINQSAAPGTSREWVEVHRLSVLPGWAGQGFGRQLMAAVEAYAKDALADAVIELEVRAAQPESEAFYRALGYRTLGVGLTLKSGAPRSYRMQKRL
jgi:GNAT superfamily N-acetyltransferase